MKKFFKELFTIEKHPTRGLMAFEWIILGYLLLTLVVTLAFYDQAANPSSMIEAVQQYCRQTHQPVPETPAEICRCIFDSLALRYRQVFQWLQELAPFKLEVLHIIGGASLNKYLNQLILFWI